MKTCFYSLLPSPPFPFVEGIPTPHEWKARRLVLLASSAAEAMALAGEALTRAEGVVITFGDQFSHQALSPLFYHLCLSRQLSPYFLALDGPSGLQGLANVFIALLGVNASDKAKVAELGEELRGRNFVLAQTRANYDKSMEKLAETKGTLQKQNDRFNNILEGTHAGTWEYNLQTGEMLTNERWWELLGYAPGNHPPADGRQWKMRLHPDESESILKILESHIRGESLFFEVEQRLRHKDGHWAWLLNRGKVISFDGKGKPLWMFGTLQDIGERKRFEEQISSMNEQLYAKNKELEQILYIASHDLRAPLVNIMGFGKELEASLKELPTYLDNELDIADMALSLDYIQKSASKMENLLAGLLKLSRLGRAALNLGPLDMGLLVKRVLEENEYSLRGTEVHIEEMPGCRGDEIAMNQVLSNLVMNAYKYRSPERLLRLLISGEIQEKRVVYRFCDNGLGIAQEDQKKVFELFHRAHQEMGEGEGLGLTIVRQNLERMGGEVWLQSEEGKGSTFFVSMPALQGTP